LTPGRRAVASALSRATVTRKMVQLVVIKRKRKRLMPRKKMMAMRKKMMAMRKNEVRRWIDDLWKFLSNNFHYFHYEINLLLCTLSEVTTQSNNFLSN